MFLASVYSFIDFPEIVIPVSMKDLVSDSVSVLPSMEFVWYVYLARSFLVSFDHYSIVFASYSVEFLL